MKTLLLTAMVISNLLTITPAFATLGNSSGGGGDELEGRVNSIRVDISKWIEDGGSNGLVLPENMTLKEYNEGMQEVLANKKVVVSFVENDDSKDEELRVIVNGIPKTCRGFISKKDFKPHILCNITRFDNTSESGQYRLIHHEYAGLAQLEKNEDAASDYVISSQLTDYLKPQTVLKLALKKVQQTKPAENEAQAACMEEKEKIKGVQAAIEATKEKELLTLIDDLYENNRLEKIKKISLIAKSEEVISQLDGIQVKETVKTYRVEAGNDSSSLRVTRLDIIPNLFIDGKSYQKKDSLGRLLDKGISCTVSAYKVHVEPGLNQENIPLPFSTLLQYYGYYVSNSSAVIVHNLDTDSDIKSEFYPNANDISGKFIIKQ